MKKKLFHALLFVAFPFLVLPLLPALVLFPLIMPPLLVLAPGLLLIVLMVITGSPVNAADKKSP